MLLGSRWAASLLSREWIAPWGETRHSSKLGAAPFAPLALPLPCTLVGALTDDDLAVVQSAS
jgi:hypothetical protein